MVSGAVIIGRQIGPRMIRPFTLHDFFELEEKCGLGLQARCPIEVAYPASLENPEGSYMEGILVNIFGGDRNPEEFRRYVGKRIIEAGTLCEKLWCENHQKGNRTFFASDLSYHKVVSDSRKADFGGEYEPFMEVLETYREKEAKARYTLIALDLSIKTRDARIKRYSKEQMKKFISDNDKLSRVNI